MSNNNIFDDFRALLNGKYGNLVVIIMAIVALCVIIQILPSLIWAAVVLIVAFIILRWLGKK